MKAKLIINDKEVEVEISDEQAQALTETKKKTGYERVANGKKYFFSISAGEVNYYYDRGDDADNRNYEGANYYSNEIIGIKNSRADRLYRQLRRFAVEHRETAIDWNKDNVKYSIAFYCGRVEIGETYFWRAFADIYFDTKETAQLAIDTFRDELIWYFTEYKDSL